MTADPRPRPRRLLGRAALLLALVVATALAWWAVGRLTAADRRLAVHVAEPATPGEPGTVPDSTTGEGAFLRVVAWNIAHGRGDDTTGWLANWRGGEPGERRGRLRRMADVLRRADADVVVLNEVDFGAAWSGGTDQAEVLARAAGYPFRVEQRNFDVRLPLATFSFGNAVLSRLPVLDARWLELPVRSRLEEIVAGDKASAVVRVRTAVGPVTVVPVHLDFRPGPARLAAARAFDSARALEPAPLVLAGDFNAAPPAWEAGTGATALGRLLASGWRSPRAEGEPSAARPTYPTLAPRHALDWILVEPPLEVVEARVLDAGPGLSDHAPVLAVVRLAPHR